MRIDRRLVVGGLGALGFAPVTSALAFAEPLTDNPFTLGVASGDPWPDGFVLWTRLAPRPLEPGYGMPPAIYEVVWELADDEGFRSVVQRGTAPAVPEWGHSVHVDVEGLSPARQYWYRFRIDGHASTTGTVRTAPAGGVAAERLRIGAAGCQNYEHGYFTAYKYMAAEGLDAIFHYGDYLYEGAQGRRTEIPMIREHLDAEPVDIDSYRRRYAQYKLDPDLQAAHASAAFLMTYDDHEVDNNWAGPYDQDGTDPAMFLIRRYAAMRAWYENLPVRRAQRPTPHGIQMFRRLDFGGLLRVHLLDTRQYRDDQICTGDNGRHCRDAGLLANGTLLGDAQHHWVEDGLDNRFGWNLMAQQVVVMPFDRRATLDAPDVVASDSWSGYPASRRRLVEAIRNKQIPNAIIATGDVHQNIVGYLPARDEEPDRDQMAVEFVCTSISSLGDGRDIKIRGADFREVIARNPNVFFANGQRGYQVFNVTPREWRTDIMKVDKVSDRSGQLSRLAAFTVEPRSPLAIPS
ncbi:MAG: alkaline phosphatase D family protein [Brevundimonas sp.]|jgi:alkaline phosphatase D|nr:alkaline phosphatase D family protein [Brevundimonas sp.]